MSTPTSVEQLQARVSYLEDRNAELEAEDAARRQAWEQQSPAKAQLEMLLARSPVIVWAVDAAGRITRLRGHGLAWLGLHDGELVGQSAADLLGGSPEAIEHLRRALGGDEFSARVRIREVFLDCHYVPIRNVDGDVTGVQGTGVVATADALARMCFATSEALLGQLARNEPPESRALDALRQRQERLRIWLQRAEAGGVAQASDDAGDLDMLSLPEPAPVLSDIPTNLPDCVVTLDASGRILDAGRLPQGVAPAEVVGSSVFAFLPPSEHAAARAALEGAVARGESTRCEFAVTRPAQAASDTPAAEPARLLCHVAPAQGIGRDGAVVAATDVTIRRLREAVARRRRLRYEQTVRLMLLGEMAGILAHKVNNPLAAITNFARGCVRRLRQVDGDGSMRMLIEALEEITDQANRASLSLRQVRDFLQPRDTTYRQVSPMAVVRRAVEVVEPLTRSRRVALHVTGGRPLPPICVDPLQIEQVLVHLLLNAVEAQSGADGVVSVSVVAREHGRVEFAVCDNGPGVPDSLHEMIFEPFFTTKPKGIGMGLAVSRSIIESHSGQLWIDRPDAPAARGATDGTDAGRDTDSRSVRGGTVLRFTLPGREESASHE